jgi:TolB-like protein
MAAARWIADERPMKADEPARLIDLAREPALRLGQLEVRPATREVVAPGGPALVLEPRIMQVLVALARRRGGVVSRDDLIAECWGGRVVGEDAINRCTQAIRKLADTYGGFSLTTIARVGYRLDEGGASPSDAAAEPVPQPAQRPLRSIAVMPFENLSRDPSDDDLVDAFTRGIAAELTRYREQFVIAPGTSLALKGQTLSPQDVARELGVNYVLEGGVLRSGDRVRIAVSLIDGVNGAHLWADRYDHDWGDAFELQDRVALEVGGNVSHQLMRVMMMRRADDGRAAAHPSAEALMALAIPEYLRFQPHGLRRAVELFDQAAALNPRLAMALAFGASARTQLIVNGWSEDPETDKRVALERCDAAAAAGADNARVLAQVGQSLASLGAMGSRAEALSKQALAISPHDSVVLMMTGTVSRIRGELDLAVERSLQALAFAPSEPTTDVRGALAVCRLLQRRCEEALELLSQNTLELPVHIATAASAYGQLGMTAEAREALARFRALVQVPFERYAVWLFQKPEHRALFLEGLAKAEALAQGG